MILLIDLSASLGAVFMRKVLIFLTFIVSYSFSSAAMAQAHGRPSKQSLVTLVGSHIGLARFCTAYGIDYTSLAARMEESLMRHISETNDHGLYVAIKIGVERGERGELWSPSTETFLDVPAAGDMRRTCQISHKELVKISKSK